jgi:hypothetical protein
MMKLSQLRNAALLIAAPLITILGAQSAFADTITTYDIAFTGTGILPTAGSFTYDSTVPSFSGFTVTWDGAAFNLTAAANAPLLVAPVPACLSGATGAAATFDLLSGACDSPGLNSLTGWSGILNLVPLSPKSFGFHSYNEITGAGIFVPESLFVSSSPPGVGGGGSWSIAAVSTPSAVPEPRSAVVLALLFCVWLVRKRILRGPRHAGRASG